jgi:RNA polymerase sigma-70 factor (sigma-E family)
LRKRDDAAFVDFVETRGTSLLRTARLLCASGSDAEDLVQTALEKAYRHWDRIEKDGNPEPYVRRILVNTVISKERRRRVLQEIHVAAPPERPAPAGTDGVELRGELMAELRTLGPRQRAVVVLRYWEDMSEKDTAKVLGCSVGTVKSQAARALEQLRRRMTRNDGEEARSGRRTRA